MRIRMINAALVAVTLTSVGIAIAQSQPAAPAKPKDPPKPAAPAVPSQAEQERMMQEWKESMKARPEQIALQKSAGTWDVTFTVSAGGPPQVSKGKATMRSVLDGKFLAEDLEGTMMGMPLRGMGLLGYDPARKQYVMTWADNMMNGIMKLTGSPNQDGSVVTMFGEMDEPMTGEFGKTVKLVTRHIDADHMQVEMWEVLYGTDFKAWEASYSRVK